jgi:hypothetical protein
MAHSIEKVIDDINDEIHTVVIKWMHVKSEKKKIELADVICDKIREVARLKRQLKILKTKNFFKKLYKDITGE